MSLVVLLWGRRVEAQEWTAWSEDLWVTQGEPVPLPEVHLGEVALPLQGKKSWQVPFAALFISKGRETPAESRKPWCKLVAVLYHKL